MGGEGPPGAKTVRKYSLAVATGSKVETYPAVFTSEGPGMTGEGEGEEEEEGSEWIGERGRGGWGGGRSGVLVVRVSLVRRVLSNLGWIRLIDCSSAIGTTLICHIVRNRGTT